MMVNYVVMIIVLLDAVLISYTWPYKTKEYNFSHRDDFYNRDSFDKGGDDDDQLIKFPVGGQGPRVDFSANGKGMDCIENVCENAADYPYEHIERIMGKIENVRNLFGHVDGSYVYQGSRGGPDEPQPESLCTTTIYTKYPKTLPNQQNVTKYIVNAGKYRQGVIFETCVKNAHCKQASFPAGYVSQCVQKYSTRRLLSVEANDGEPAFDSFVVPSCCVCTIKQMKWGR